MSDTTSRLRKRNIAQHTQFIGKSPMARLSDDILPLIFEAVHSEGSSAQHTGLQRAIQISSVCKRWRRIACNLSILWTALDVALDRPRPLSSLRSILKRSRHRLLDIALLAGRPQVAEKTWTSIWPQSSGAFSFHPVEHLVVCEVLPLLTARISRWRSFVVDSHTTSAVQAALALLYEPAPHLRQLELVARDSIAKSGHQLCMLHGFGGGFAAPQLRTLNTCAMSGVTEDDLSLFPALEEYTTDFPRMAFDDLGSFIETLRPLRKLRSLHISGKKFTPKRAFEDWPDAPKEPVYLPALEKLAISAISLAEMTLFLDNLEAPALKMLKLASPITSDSGSIAFLCDTWKDHFPALNNLLLVDMPTTIDHELTPLSCGHVSRTYRFLELESQEAETTKS